MFAGNEHKETERKYIEELLAYKIEGMIIFSHTIPSEELAAYKVPIVTVEREDKFVCSVNTDNYMGGVQAAGLLVKSGCDVLIHINSDVSEDVPSYGRITGFCDICRERNIPHELILADMGNSYSEISAVIQKLLETIEKKYSGKCKGIFMSNDTHANILLNILIRKYGKLPDDYKIVGFDNTSISREAVIPISTAGQQIETMANEAMELLLLQINERKKRKPVPLDAPIHKTVTPILYRRDTTG